MPTVGMQLISRIIKTGEFASATQEGISEIEMLSVQDKTLWRVLHAYFNDPSTAGSVPDARRLKQDFPFLEENCDPPHLTLSALCHEARKAYTTTELYAIQKFTADNAASDPYETLAKIHQATGNLLSRRASGKQLDMIAAIANVISTYNAVASGLVQSVGTWPWPTMQAETGGLQEDDYVIIFGRPKNMKTWALASFVAHLFMTDQRVLFYTKEMTKENMWKRLAACILHLGYKPLRQGKLDPADEATLMEFLPQIADLSQHRGDIKVLDVSDAGGVHDTIPWLYAQVEDYKPDIVAVDGLHLMSAGPGTEKKAEWERIMKNSRDIRQFQLRTKKPLIVTVQANRGAANTKGAGSELLAGSDALAQDATTFMRAILSKERREIDLVVGGSREYDLPGITIGAEVANDFRERRSLTESAALEAQQAAAAAEATEAEKKATRAPKHGRAPSGEDETDRAARRTREQVDRLIEQTGT